MKISYNLATNLAGIIHITDKDNNILEANIDIKENGFDPVDSATMNVKCDTDKPFTIHVLFPEIVSDELPGLIELNCKVLSEKTHLVIDATDVAGKCTALPFYKFGKWCQGSNKISMDKEYMVWFEGAERLLRPPLRLKYLLIMSTDGSPVSVEISNLSMEF